jgi:hypothetical protein
MASDSIFAAADFVLTDAGQCRVNPQVARKFAAETMMHSDTSGLNAVISSLRLSSSI